jgi:murein DD-endopeptidase MepM/ murein hydrolase activator NlpD
MKQIILVLWLCTLLQSASISYKEWKKGETFSEYMTSHQIPASLLDSISEEDQKFLSEIRSRYKYYELTDEEGRLLQALIPISSEMQIHLFRKKGEYGFDIIPIVYKEQEYPATIEIKSNLHTDICNTLKLPAVADKMGQLLKGVVDARRFKKGDRVSFLYDQKTRLGQPYVMPHIKIALVESGKKKQFVYADEDGYGYKSDKASQAYTVTGKKRVVYTRRVLQRGRGSRFGMPLRHARITSSFSYRRWHPILHRYRPHHGTDFGARRGTPLLAVNDGRVSYAGWMRGYGKVVKIRHAGGYESLYAHQSRIRVKRGQYVKKGQVIGYVGSTGRSTGPHLHFGLMKNGRWIDPMKVLRRKSVGSKTILKKFTKYEKVKTTKYKTVVIKDAKKNKEKLLAYIRSGRPSYVWDTSRLLKVYVNNREIYENRQ